MVSVCNPDVIIITVIQFVSFNFPSLAIQIKSKSENA